MFVKIGNKMYTSEAEPIMIVLSEDDKDHISKMGSQTKYCSYPEGMDVDSILVFMGHADGSRLIL